MLVLYLPLAIGGAEIPLTAAAGPSTPGPSRCDLSATRRSTSTSWPSPLYSFRTHPRRTRCRLHRPSCDQPGHQTGQGLSLVRTPRLAPPDDRAADQLDVLDRTPGDSSFIVPYLRGLGYKLSPVVQTGSNFGSSLKHDTPYLSSVGTGTVVASGLSIINADYTSTSFRMSRTSIGAHSFLGNDIAYPSQSRMGDNCLLATKVLVPIEGKIREGVGLLALPASRSRARSSVTTELRSLVERRRTASPPRRQEQAQRRHRRVVPACAVVLLLPRPPDRHFARGTCTPPSAFRRSR